jgi:hypothetical protein
MSFFRHFSACFGVNWLQIGFDYGFQNRFFVRIVEVIVIYNPIIASFVVLKK